MLRMSSLFKYCSHSILHQPGTIGHIPRKLFLLNKELLCSGYNHTHGKDRKQKNIYMYYSLFFSLRFRAEVRSLSVKD